MEEENLESRESGERTVSIVHDGGDISPRPVVGGGTTVDLDGSPRGSDHDYAEALQDENVNLRRRLAETEYGFQRRLDRQTDLISKLQDKLKDSQRRMAEMEVAERNAALTVAVSSPVSPPGPSRMPFRASGLGIHGDGADESVLNRLLEEQDKSATLHEVNTTLRQEMEDMRSANFHLTSDLLRVTQMYDNIRQEVHRQSEEYKKTETTYVSHLASEHRQMLNMWRSLQQLRREFMDTRSMTMRGLSSMESEMQRTVKNATSACRQFGLRNAFVASTRALERFGITHESHEQSTVKNVEQLVWENVRRLTENQNVKEDEIKTMQIRIEELVEEKRSFESYLSEKEKQIETMKRSLTDSKEERDDSFIDYLHHALRDMADSASHESAGGDGTGIISPRRRARSHSPRSLRGRAAAETTVRMVKDAFERRQREINELSGRLRSAQQRLAEVKPSGINTVERDRVERDLNEAQLRISTLQRERDDAVQHKEKYRSQLSVVQGDRMSSEKKLRDALEEQIASLNNQLESCHKRILELESTESRLDEENDRLGQDLDRIKSETTKLRNLLDSSQSTLAESRTEVSKLKAAVARLERDNRDLASENLNAAERANKEAAKSEELATEVHRLTSNEKSINDRLAAMQLEIQTLTREKQSVLKDRQALQGRLEQLDDERSELRSKREAAETEVRRLQEQVNVLQHDKLGLNQERTMLVSHLDRRSADLREFESQLAALRKEYTDTDAQLKLATQKQHDLELQLESCRRDLITEQQYRSSSQEERRQIINERTEVESRVTTLVEQIRRFESSNRQLEEKAQSQILDFERRLEEADSQKKTAEGHITELSRKLEDLVEEKRSAETRTNSLQSILVSQEELLRSKENDRRLAVGKISQLEVQLRSRDTQLKQITGKFESLSADWEKAQSEMRKMKDDLEASFEERRHHTSEMSDLTTELHRTRIQLTEAAANVEAADERIRTNLEHLRAEEQRSGRLQSELEHYRSMLARTTESEMELRSQLESVRALMSDHTSSGQTLQEQLVSLQQQLRAAEQEKRMADDRLRDAREQLAKGRKDLKQRSDVFNETESRVTELESKLVEMDSQLKTLQKMLDISQETETDLKRQLEQTVAQKQSSHVRLSEMQRKFQELELERREWTTLKMKLERDKASLKHELTACHKDRRKNDSLIRTAEAERAALDKAVSAIEKENMELHRAVTQLQAQVVKMEQAHAQRLAELSQRHRVDLDNEISQLRSEKQDAFRQLDLLEKMYKQKLRSLEDQIARLKEQLRLEVRRRHDFFSRAVQQSRDVAHLRAGLDQSFASLRNDPLLDSLLLPSTGSHGNLGYTASTIRLGSAGQRPATAGETNVTLLPNGRHSVQ